MIYLATETTEGPSLTGHKTLTQAIKAWEFAKGDPTCTRACLQTDRGSYILSFDRPLSR